MATSSSSAPSGCSSEPPLLSQDEFFRHLQLQSVHTKAKFTYRQALKERLRANPKKVLVNNNTKGHEEVKPEPPSTPPPRVMPRAMAATTPHISPKWLTPRSCRRIFGRPKLRREQKRAISFEEVRQDKIRYYLANVRTFTRTEYFRMPPFVLGSFVHLKALSTYTILDYFNISLQGREAQNVHKLAWLNRARSFTSVNR